MSQQWKQNWNGSQVSPSGQGITCKAWLDWFIMTKNGIVEDYKHEMLTHLMDKYGADNIIFDVDKVIVGGRTIKIVEFTEVYKREVIIPLERVDKINKLGL